MGTWVLKRCGGQGIRWRGPDELEAGKNWVFNESGEDDGSGMCYFPAKWFNERRPDTLVVSSDALPFREPHGPQIPSERQRVLRNVAAGMIRVVSQEAKSADDSELVARLDVLLDWLDPGKPACPRL